MSTKILVVDDDSDLLELLSLNLGKEGYRVRTADSGTRALGRIEAERPDLILLDIMLDDISGIKLTRRLKSDPATASIPIILLTAKDSEIDVVVGLSVGADDYVTKPFSGAVLLARIEAVLRRVSSGKEPTKGVLSAGDVTIEPESMQVFAGGQRVELTSTEYNILCCLIRAGGAVVSREEIKKKIESDSASENDRVVDVHIASLRKKLGSSRKIIRTIHGHGYRIQS